MASLIEASKRLLPLLNRVLIKKVDPVTQTKGGVLIPESNRTQVSRGTVVAVGPGTIDKTGNKIPVCLKVGDAVLLPDYGGTKVTYGEEENKQEFFLYRDEDVLAKISTK